MEKEIIKFQEDMMKLIVQECTLYDILAYIHTSLHYPTIIENGYYKLIRFHGVTEAEYEQFQRQMVQGDLTHYEENAALISLDTQYAFVAPLKVDDIILGYCSILLTADEVATDGRFWLYKDTIIHTLLAFLILEKARHESITRRKSNLFDELLADQYSNEDLEKKGLFLNINFSLPYYILTIQLQFVAPYSLEEEYSIYAELYNRIHFVNAQRQVAHLATEKKGRLILYVQPNASIGVEDIVQALYTAIADSEYIRALKIGVSNKGLAIDAIGKHYKESQTALKLAINDDIFYFNALGFIGVFINNADFDLIKLYATNDLGELYAHQNEKNKELLRTIYYFLLNGCNYKQTMHDLSISLTGLRYRVTKFEDMLGKNFKNADDAYQTLLLLKILIIYDEIEIAPLRG